MNQKDVIVMVGLPARGKSYISKNVKRFLRWTGVKVRVFNVGEYRRVVQSSCDDHHLTISTTSADFFRPDNAEALKLREQCALDALDDIRQWLSDGGQVAILDATNSNKSRRRLILDELDKVDDFKVRVLFVESICDDDAIIDANIREVKVSGPDYMATDPEIAIADFRQRIEHYKLQYETIDDQRDKALSYLKIFNKGERFTVNNMKGQMQSEVIYFLMNHKPVRKTIYLATVSSIKDLRRLKRLGKLADEEGLSTMSMVSIRDIEANSRSYEDLVMRVRPVIMQIERESRDFLVVCHEAVARCLIAYFLELNAGETLDINIPCDDLIKLKSTSYGFEMKSIRIQRKIDRISADLSRINICGDFKG